MSGFNYHQKIINWCVCLHRAVEPNVPTEEEKARVPAESMRLPYLLGNSRCTILLQHTSAKVCCTISASLLS